MMLFSKLCIKDTLQYIIRNSNFNQHMKQLHVEEQVTSVPHTFTSNFIISFRHRKGNPKKNFHQVQHEPSSMVDPKTNHTNTQS